MSAWFEVLEASSTRLPLFCYCSSKINDFYSFLI